MHPVLLGHSEQTALLSRAWARGLTDGRLVSLSYDTLLFTLPSCDHSYRALGTGRPLQEACDAMLTVGLESSLRDKAFEASGADGEAAVYLEPAGWLAQTLTGRRERPLPTRPTGSFSTVGTWPVPYLTKCLALSVSFYLLYVCVCERVCV